MSKHTPFSASLSMVRAATDLVAGWLGDASPSYFADTVAKLETAIRVWKKVEGLK